MAGRSSSSASILAGAILPEIFLIAFFQRGRLTKRNLRNLLFTIPIWAFDGSLVDLLYRGEAALLGNVVTVPVVIGKICLDQFGYNPFFAAPFGVLTYEWKNSGFSFRVVRPGFYAGRIIARKSSPRSSPPGRFGFRYDGDHLLAPARAAVPALQSRAHFLGASAHLHDE